MERERAYSCKAEGGEGGHEGEELGAEQHVDIERRFL